MLTLIGSFIWVAGCKMTDREGPNLRPTSAPTGKNGHFVLHAEKLRRLRAQVNSLKLGDARATVAPSVGAPDHEELIGPKRGPRTCRSLVYYVALVEETPGNVNDKQVTLVFDRKEDRLVAIMSNLDGVPSRGDFTSCRGESD